MEDEMAAWAVWALESMGKTPLPPPFLKAQIFHSTNPCTF